MTESKKDAKYLKSKDKKCQIHKNTETIFSIVNFIVENKYRVTCLLNIRKTKVKKL